MATDGKILQRGTEHRGIMGGAELLRQTEPDAFSGQAARKALAALKAKPAPAGRFTVIFHPSITGLLVHEALGHNAEADAVWAGQSILEGRLGDRLAPGPNGVGVPLDEMLRGVQRGVYLEDGHWGYVFVQKGQFICHAGQAHMIENGALGEPLRDVSISSLTLDVLANIDAVGNDFEMKMPGMCGKGGQSAPIDCGGPHVRVADVVVGGQQGV